MTFHSKIARKLGSKYEFCLQSNLATADSFLLDSDRSGIQSSALSLHFLGNALSCKIKNLTFETFYGSLSGQLSRE